MGDPGVIILDEPTVGLDLGGREGLVRSLADLAADTTAPPIVYVTHHVEEIPPGFSSLLALREGRVAAKGRLETELTAELLTDMFGIPFHLRHERGRYAAIAI
jgi:iron complex transport system ATP-binding protein